MKKRRKKVTAGESLHGQNLVSSVVVASEAAVPTGLKVTAHKCRGCDTTFATNADIKPFCVHCGSDSVITVNDMGGRKVESMADESKLSSVQCPGCQNRNILSDTTAKALEGYMACVVCSHDILFETVAEDDEPPAAEDPMVDDTDQPTEDPALEGDTADGESDIGGDDVGGEPEEEDEVLMNLSELALASAPDRKVVFVRAGKSSICAYVGDVSIARLKQADAGDNEDLFQEQAFLKSIRQSMATAGLDKTLDDFGFTKTQVALSGSHLRKFKISEAVTAEREIIRKEMADSQAVLQQCLQIAAAGLNKGFFKDRVHVLKAKLYESLVEAGMKSPNVVIDQVFSAHSDEYNTTLLALATELLGKSEDVRNELADTIQGTNYQLAEDEPTEDDELELEEEFTEDDLEDAPLESRFEASLRPSRPRRLNGKAAVHSHTGEPPRSVADIRHHVTSQAGQNLFSR